MSNKTFSVYYLLAQDIRSIEKVVIPTCDSFEVVKVECNSQDDLDRNHSVIFTFARENLSKSQH